MPKVTGLSAEELETLNTTLESLLHKGLAAFDRAATNKAERTVYNLVEMGMKMAEHLSVERKLGTLVEGTNKLLPKLTKYFNDEALFEIIPAELKTAANADLLDKAGAGPLAKLLRETLPAAQSAAPATTNAGAPIAKL